MINYSTLITLDIFAMGSGGSQLVGPNASQSALSDFGQIRLEGLGFFGLPAKSDQKLDSRVWSLNVVTRLVLFDIDFTPMSAGLHHLISIIMLDEHTPIRSQVEHRGFRLLPLAHPSKRILIDAVNSRAQFCSLAVQPEGSFFLQHHVDCTRQFSCCSDDSNLRSSRLLDFVVMLSNRRVAV